ncbi:MAG: hypothetical protein NTV52_22250 [Acidobacteria bacterium]|nr:hypothetical protein [Acidobacteriota bacterium]
MVAAGMLEEMADGDVGVTGVGGGGGTADVVEIFGVEGELPFLDELEDGHGGDGFGDTGDAEEGVWLDGFFGDDVGDAEAAGVDEATVLSDGDGDSGDLILGQDAVDGAVEGGEFEYGGAGLGGREQGGAEQGGDEFELHEMSLGPRGVGGHVPEVG